MPCTSCQTDLSVFELTKESIGEMQAEQQTGNGAGEASLPVPPAEGSLNDGNEPLAATTDAAEAVNNAETAMRTDDATSTAMEPTSTAADEQDFLWPDAGVAREFAEDPILLEDQAANAETTPTLALVHGVPAKKSGKKKKPKFRSKKKTTKSK